MLGTLSALRKFIVKEDRWLHNPVTQGKEVDATHSRVETEARVQ